MNLIFYLLAIFLLVAHATGNRNTQAKTQGNTKDSDDDAGPPLTEEEFKASRKLVFKPYDPNDPLKGKETISKGSNTPKQHAKRQMVKDGGKQWPSGIVPYRLHRNYTREQRLAVARAILEFHNKTCIEWVARKRETDYVFFILTPKGTCYSEIGKYGGRQFIGLSEDCLTKLYSIVHEMMHAIGFVHEHQRTDRDKYVWLFYWNINKAFRFAFDIANDTYTIGPYDYKSIMHYPPNSYAIRPQIGTIGAYDTNIVIELGSTFSELDVKKIRAVYECDPLNGHIF